MSTTKWTPGPWSLETVPTSCGVCHKIGPFPSKGIFHTHGYACVYAAERYVAENRNDGGYCGLLLDALTNDSRVMANLAKGNWTQLSVEWDRVFDRVVDDVARRGK